MTPGWLVLDFALREEPPLEIRAEATADGCWHISGLHSASSAGGVTVGWLNASEPDFGVTLLSA